MRTRHLLAVAIPVGAAVAILVAVVGFSRVLLSVKPNAATTIALIVAAGILGSAAYAATRLRVGGATVGGMLGTVAGVAMLAGGIAIVAIGPAVHEEEAVTVAIAAPTGASVNGFDTSELSFPADTPVALAFDNQEGGILHNVVIAAGEDATGDTLFDGQLITGPSAITYEIDPLAAGTYFFYCKVHPTTMTGTLTVAEGVTSLVAKGTAFDRSDLELVAGSETTLSFANQDPPGTQHNVAIYTDPSAAEALFRGDFVDGGETTEYTIAPLEEGTYFFRCDVHPTQMTGSVTVAPGAGPPEGSPPQESPAG
jgi:plastocyanin